MWPTRAARPWTPSFLPPLSSSPPRCTGLPSGLVYGSSQDLSPTTVSTAVLSLLRGLHACHHRACVLMGVFLNWDGTGTKSGLEGLPKGACPCRARKWKIINLCGAVILYRPPALPLGASYLLLRAMINTTLDKKKGHLSIGLRYPPGQLSASFLLLLAPSGLFVSRFSRKPHSSLQGRHQFHHPLKNLYRVPFSSASEARRARRGAERPLPVRCNGSQLPKFEASNHVHLSHSTSSDTTITTTSRASLRVECLCCFCAPGKSTCLRAFFLCSKSMRMLSTHRLACWPSMSARFLALLAYALLEGPFVAS